MIIRKHLSEKQIPQPSVVAISGNTDATHQEQAFKAGMNCCLFKPVDYQDIL